MNDFEKIGKQMPYKESESYITSLIEHCTETALSGGRKQHRRSYRLFFSFGTVAAALILAAGLTRFIEEPGTRQENKWKAEIEKAAPLDEMLNTLDDEEIQSLGAYCNDFPDYEYLKNNLKRK